MVLDQTAIPHPVSHLITTELATFALHDVSGSSTGASTPTEAPPRSAMHPALAGFALNDLPSSGTSTPPARAVAGHPLQLASNSNTTSGTSSPAPPVRAELLTSVGEQVEGPSAFALSDVSGSDSGMGICVAGWDWCLDCARDQHHVVIDVVVFVTSSLNRCG